jgi:hypothetical protein
VYYEGYYSPSSSTTSTSRGVGMCKALAALRPLLAEDSSSVTVAVEQVAAALPHH